jgi:hypothetical protein
MKKLYISPAKTTPEILLSPEENTFYIRGISSPEDVRAIYYPVIDWIKEFIDEILEGDRKSYSSDFPLKLQVNLDYFNSSSAKFLFDIFSDLKRLIPARIPLIVEWFYAEEDNDLKDAGEEIALLAGLELTYIMKNK